MTYINIFPIHSLQDNYVWTITDTKNNSSLIVDPGEAAPVLDYIQKHNLSLLAILITHHHWDHTNGINEILNYKNVPVYGPAIENIPHLTHPLNDGDHIEIPEFPLNFKVLEIHGHTAGHIAYYTPNMVFCGDTLFAAGCGRLFEGTAMQMFSSLQKLSALPDETKVYCAHEYTLKNLHFAEIVEPGNKKIAERILHVKKLRENNSPSLPSVMKKEKETNPFLRCEVGEVIANVEKHAGKKLVNALEVFTELRKWKDKL